MVLKIKGYEVLIDDEDYEKIKNYNWKIIIKYNNTPYVQFGTTITENGIRKSIKYYMHRVIMDVMGLDWKKTLIDHINGNTLDNRKCNLRIASSSLNGHNSKKNRKNTTGYRGVDYKKQDKKFRARVSFNGVRYEKCYFDTAEEAAKAYDEMAKEFFGTSAKLNFPN